MKFVEITGDVLLQMAEPDEIGPLRASGVTEHSKVRVNQQGDIELYNHGGWHIIGGLLGDFQARIKRITGLDWS
jgi:hypothetical protein